MLLSHNKDCECNQANCVLCSNTGCIASDSIRPDSRVSAPPDRLGNQSWQDERRQCQQNMRRRVNYQDQVRYEEEENKKLSTRWACLILYPLAQQQPAQALEQASAQPARQPASGCQPACPQTVDHQDTKYRAKERPETERTHTVGINQRTTLTTSASLHQSCMSERQRC